MLASLLTILAILAIATPLWFWPAYWLRKHCGWGRRPDGRVKHATMIDWLNATGIGLIVGTVLAILIQWLR